MALFIRDARVETLVEEVRRITNAKSKTEAVRNALAAQLATYRRSSSPRHSFERAQAMADALGPFDHDRDMKTYMDEMWGDA